MLRANGILALVADRSFGPNEFRIDFFGRPCAIPRGPAFFHIKTGAPIVPIFCLRKNGDTFKLILEAPIELRPSGDEKADLVSITNAYIKVLERYIMQYPEQWYMFARLGSKD